MQKDQLNGNYNLGKVEAYKRASIYGKMSENWIMGASLQNDRPKWKPMSTRNNKDLATFKRFKVHSG